MAFGYAGGMTNVTADARGVGWNLYYGWVVVGVAALAMVGTLPGRTQGLGLITEPLLRDLAVDRVRFAGDQLRRHAGRLAVLLRHRRAGRSPRQPHRPDHAVAGAGRGGHGTERRPERGDAARHDHADPRPGAERPVGGQPGDARQVVPAPADVGDGGLRAGDERRLHAGVSRRRRDGAGSGLAGGLGVGGRRARVRPRAACVGCSSGGSPTRTPNWRPRPTVRGAEATDATLAAALRSPAFWVFGIASSLYGLAASGIGLFNESILAERGFAPDVYYTALAVTAITGLAGNFVAGAWADRGSLRRVLIAALVLLAAALVALPRVTTTAHVMAQAVAMGLSGGFVMVVFFSFWGKAYGRTHLGRIQGVAQALTVFASAVGPLLLAWCADATGSYAAAFYALAATLVVSDAGGLASCACLPAPNEPRLEPVLSPRYVPCRFPLMEELNRNSDVDYVRFAAGAMAKLVMPGRSWWVIVTMTIGIAGAVLGGFIGRAMGLRGRRRQASACLRWVSSFGSSRLHQVGSGVPDEADRTVPERARP